MSLRHRLLPLVLLCLALAGCAVDAELRREASIAMKRGDFETSLQLLEDAKRVAPESVQARTQLLQTRMRVFDELLAQAEEHRAAGRLAAARVLVERLLLLDPSSQRASTVLRALVVEASQERLLAEARELVKAGKLAAALDKTEQALKDNPRHAGLLDLRRNLESEKRSREVAAAKASLGDRGRVSLDFREATLRTVLDAIARSSGLNFVFDKDLRQDSRVTVFLEDTPVEEALDLVISTNQLVKKVLDSKTLLVYPNTPEKLKDYQEQVVRVFQPVSVDAKSAASFLKTMLRVKDPFVDERTNVLALRESPENIALAERLMALYDAGEPEVLLELEVLEVSETRLTELGLRIPDAIGLNILPPAGAAAAAGLTLGDIGSLGKGNLGVAIGGASLNFKREVGDFTTLANPKIRAKNKEKASILIGDKIPVVTATTGNAGFVTENVSYLDVGLKLNVEPTVYPDDEVGIRVSLEVSSLGTAIKTASGGLAYQIGTRNATTVLRLRDGETQMLAGLISRDERTSSARVPGFGDIPVVGRLLSSNRDTGTRTELVLAITPRVLRNVTRHTAHETELWVGTDSLPRLRPYGGVHAASLDPPVRSAPLIDPSAQGSSDFSRVPPSPGLTVAASEAGPSAAKPEYRAMPQERPIALSWVQPTPTRVGDVFEVQLKLSSSRPLRGAPVELAWDVGALELIDATEGDFFNRDGVSTAFSMTRQSEGSASVGALRRTATGISGEATFATLKLKALKKGAHHVRVVRLQPLSLDVNSAAVEPKETINVSVE